MTGVSRRTGSAEAPEIHPEGLGDARRHGLHPSNYGANERESAVSGHEGTAFCVDGTSMSSRRYSYSGLVTGAVSAMLRYQRKAGRRQYSFSHPP